MIVPDKLSHAILNRSRRCPFTKYEEFSSSRGYWEEMIQPSLRSN